MAPGERLRWMVWLTLLAGASGLAFWGEASKDSVGVEVVSALPSRNSNASPSDLAKGGTAPVVPRVQAKGLDGAQAPKLEIPIDRDQLIDAPLKAETQPPVDLFAPRSWLPPLAPQAPVVAVTPTAPPLPYTVLGKKQQSGQWEVYLGQGDRALIAREGADLDGIYQVVRIQPPMMTLQYRSLGQNQTLTIGD